MPAEIGRHPEAFLEQHFEADFLALVGVHAVGVEVHYAHDLVLAEVQAGAHNFCRNVLD